MEGRRQAAETAEQSRVAAAWYVEAFRRTKKLPPLEGLLRRDDEQREQTPDDMLAVMKVIQAGGGDVTITEIGIGDL